MRYGLSSGPPTRASEASAPAVLGRDPVLVELGLLDDPAGHRLGVAVVAGELALLLRGRLDPLGAVELEQHGAGGRLVGGRVGLGVHAAARPAVDLGDLV